MGDLYVKLADQIYSPITDKKEVVVEKKLMKKTKKRIIRERKNNKIIINMAEVSGRIKKLKNDITFEIYQPAIDKLNTKVEELKKYKQGLKDKLEKLKKNK